MLHKYIYVFQELLNFMNIVDDYGFAFGKDEFLESFINCMSWYKMNQLTFHWPFIDFSLTFHWLFIDFSLTFHWIFIDFHWLSLTFQWVWVENFWICGWLWFWVLRVGGIELANSLHQQQQGNFPANRPLRESFLWIASFNIYCGLFIYWKSLLTSLQLIIGPRSPV